MTGQDVADEIDRLLIQCARANGKFAAAGLDIRVGIDCPRQGGAFTPRPLECAGPLNDHGDGTCYCEHCQP